MDGTELRHIHIVPQHTEAFKQQQQSDDTLHLHDKCVAPDSTFIPGPCQHNKKFACVFIPCVVPLFYIGGELLFGSAVFCILMMYLVENTSRSKKSSLVAYVVSVLLFQLSSMFCLVPFLWKSVFNLGLIFIYNVFIVLSGGVGLFQFKQLQHEEPEFIKNMEYVVYISYPIVGQLTLTAVSGNVFSWSVVPFFCIIFGFLFLQIFYPPSRSSFIYHNVAHKAGEERPLERFLLSSLEKTLLLVNFVTVPGSMFIVINFMEFLHIITWIKLLLCGVLPVFLCTCLDIDDEIEFLEFSKDAVAKAKLGSGLGSLLLFIIILISSGTLGFHSLPLILGNVICGVLIVITSGREKWRVYQNVLYVVLGILSLLGVCMLPWTLIYYFHFFSLPLWGVNFLLGLVSCLSVLCVFVVSLSTNREWINPLIVFQSIVFVLCETILAKESLYPVYFLVGTMLCAGYISERLHSVGKLHSQSMLLCIAVHGSKVPLCLTLVLPFRQTSSVLLPSMVVISPALLMFLFTYVVSKIIESPEALSINEGLKLCMASAVVTVAVYDVLVLPLWLLMTHRIPSPADVLAGVLFVWGAICLKLSHMHFSHNLFLKRLNILVVCVSVLMEIIQPDLNVYRVLQGAAVYVISLFYPFFSNESVLSSEATVLPWLILVALSVLLAVLTKLITLEQASLLQRLAVAALIGLALGFKVSSAMMPPATRPLLVILFSGISSTVTFYFLIISWKPIFGEAPPNLSLPYVLLSGSFLACVLSETLTSKTLDVSKGPHKLPPVFSSSFYHLCLYIILGLGLRRDTVAQEDSLEEKKGKLPSGLVLQSFSFFSNISICISFLLLLLCSSPDYWELWMSLAVLLLLFLRPEGLPYIRGVRIQFTPTLPATVALALCMYSRTVTEALPTQLSFLSVTGYVLEMLLLVSSLPTYIVSVCALWRAGEISLVEQQLVMFTAPSNVVLLIYCSTLSAKILGFVGIFAVYWLFYHVKITESK
ncbi:uncharacterized protein LOC111331163 isoform X1 [Stylophora pistillata]|uniref:uncharacterized protein LOC111331163 isoform X1 n=1 Tax=Stylophora pistillata TaxID=50429 RepID=UPI000C0467F3|nr:uncharacterized protein LOC111331163 isoform X1 [Stylophora pistillata]